MIHLKHSLCILLLLIIPFSVYSQYSFQKEKDKYWVYRERLKNFMVSSNGAAECKGCDMPATGRDRSYLDSNNQLTVSPMVRWGDAPWMLGYWIGNLAMEYQLLTQSGLSSTSPEVMQTKKDLYGAIQSINRLDGEAEVSWGCSGTFQENINGFLLADNVPGDFSQVQSIIDGLNEGLVPPPDYYRVKCINSAYTEYITPREASQDHLCGLFIGMALVKKYLPEWENWNNTQFTNGSSEASNSSFVTEVQIISNRIIDYLTENSWIYMNKCEFRCVYGIYNDHVNPTPCGASNPDMDPEGNICDKGGALAFTNAIGFAAANKYIQGNSPDATLLFYTLVGNPICQIAWNNSLYSNNNYIALNLAAIGNIWEVGICWQDVTYHLCTGIPFICNCCIDLGYITVPIPVPCSSSSAYVSDHLVSWGKTRHYEHLYLLHKLLYSGGSDNISNDYYKCLLNAAPCRGYDGSGSIEWGDNNRILGGRNQYSSSFSRVDFLFYYNLYNLNNHEAGYPYAPIPIKQLAPDNLFKSNYIEYDKKNFIAANTITAANLYSIKSDPIEGQGRVTFAAGQKIILSDGFKVTNGGYFHGYIDPSISAMNCSDPPSQTDCSSLEKIIYEVDTVADLDSVLIPTNIKDSITNTLPCPIDTLHLYGKNIDSSATSFYWDFGNGQTSYLENPSVYYSSPGTYLLTIIATSSSKTDTFSTQIIVPVCNNLRTNNQNQQATTNNKINNLKTGIKIIPNPSNGIFTISQTGNSDNLNSIEIYNTLGNKLYQSDFETNTKLINISQYPKGLYIVKVFSGNNVFVEKVVYN